MASARPLQFVVLGGGISGLTAAHSLLKHCRRACKITLIESAKRCGGWLQSTKSREGAIFEHGPRGIRPFGPGGAAVLDLVHDLGLEGDVVPSLQSSEAGGKRFIYRKSKLASVPMSTLPLLLSKGPLSHRLYRIIVKDLMTKRKENDDDETVYSFFKRRFGDEAAEFLSDPFCRGIFAGDCRQLSMQACFPMLVEQEKRYRSIVAGALLSKDEPLDPNLISPLTKRAHKEKWRTWTLGNGLQNLGTTLERYLSKNEVDIQVNTRCLALNQKGDQMECITDQGSIMADQVIASLPAYRLNTMLRDVDPCIQRCLEGIPFASCAVVNLEYGGDQLEEKGFGFLVPSSEDLGVLGIIFDTCTFPELARADKETTQLTVMMGGSNYEQMYGCPSTTDKSKLKTEALEAVARSLNITAEPEHCIVNVMTNCIPQYQLGHVDRLVNARKILERMRIPLTLTGASYDGVGVPDIVLKTQRRIIQMLHSLPE